MTYRYHNGLWGSSYQRGKMCAFLWSRRRRHPSQISTLNQITKDCCWLVFEDRFWTDFMVFGRFSVPVNYSNLGSLTDWRYIYRNGLENQSKTGDRYQWYFLHNFYCGMFTVSDNLWHWRNTFCNKRYAPAQISVTLVTKCCPQTPTSSSPS